MSKDTETIEVRGCFKGTKTYGVAAKHSDQGEFVISADAIKLEIFCL